MFPNTLYYITTVYALPQLYPWACYRNEQEQNGFMTFCCPVLIYEPTN